MSRGDLPPPPPYSSSGGGGGGQSTPNSIPVDQMHHQLIHQSSPSSNMSMSNHLPGPHSGLQSISSLYGIHGGGDSPNVSSPSSLPPMSSFIHHRSSGHQLVHSLPPSSHLDHHRGGGQQQHITNMSNTSDHYTPTIVSISSPNTSINNNNNHPQYVSSSGTDVMSHHHVIQDVRCPNVTAGWTSNNSPTINHQHLYPPQSHHTPIVEVCSSMSSIISILLFPLFDTFQLNHVQVMSKIGSMSNQMIVAR